MRDWSFENEIEVYEEAYDSDLHCLKVYSGEKFLGTVYPSSIEDMQQLFEELDAGNDPVSNGWEDGLGNACTLSGWGSENGITAEQNNQMSDEMMKDMWMSREKAAKYFFEKKYGKGTECKIEENEVICYGNDECFELDEFYQIGVKEDGTILHFYYNIDGSIDIDEQDIDWDHPVRIENVTNKYEDIIDYVKEKNGEGYYNSDERDRSYQNDEMSL